MCNPVAVIAAGSIASAAWGLNKQRKAAKKSEKFYRAAQAEQEEQIHASKSAQADDRARRARREKSRLRALSAEAGLGGITSETLLNNADFQGGFDISRISLSQEFAQTSSRYQLQSNLNNIQQPDYIGTALKTGLQLYDRTI